MKQKFNFIYETVKANMEKLDKKQISVEQAKAMSSLAKQANNVLVTQLDASKFLNNVKDAVKKIILQNYCHLSNLLKPVYVIVIANNKLRIILILLLKLLLLMLLRLMIISPLRPVPHHIAYILPIPTPHTTSHDRS